MPTPSSDWLVSVPLSQLVALKDAADEMDKLRKENQELRRRMDGLHRTQYDLIEIIGDLRKSVNVSASRGA